MSLQPYYLCTNVSDITAFSVLLEQYPGNVLSTIQTQVSNIVFTLHPHPWTTCSSPHVNMAHGHTDIHKTEVLLGSMHQQ